MNKKVAALFVLVIALVSFLAFTLWRNNVYSAKIEIEVAPSDSSIDLDGKKTKEGTISVKPGLHKISVVREGFDSYEKTIDAKKGQSVYFGVALTPKAQEFLDYYRKNEKEGLKAQGISSRNADSQAVNLLNDLPIVSKLPYIGAGFSFRVDYGVSRKSPPSSVPAIYITAPNEAGKQAALKWIRGLGYDPEKFEIIYVENEL